MSDAAPAAEKPAIILSLDGGGVRGLSSLLILEKILEKIQEERDLDEVPKPSQIFSLIGGTGTGGTIAIMLGRLGMTVDESIRVYKKLIDTAPAPKSSQDGGLSPGCFSTSELETAIGEVVQEKYSGANTGQNGNPLFRDKSCTKTAVLALTKVNVETLPTLFTTYRTSSTFSACTVLDVAKAVSAANTLSDSIELGRDKEVFIGAEYGYNNPCEILMSEAQKQFPNRELIILSIGTGITEVVEISDESGSLHDALAKIAASSKAAEARLHDKYHDSSLYHRFNVENGLREIKPKTVQTAAEISAHSRNYMQENEGRITDFADLVKSHVETPPPELEEQACAHAEQRPTPADVSQDLEYIEQAPPAYSKVDILNPSTEQAKAVATKLREAGENLKVCAQRREVGENPKVCV